MHSRKGKTDMEFTLRISMGNDAMQSVQDVADALQGVAEYILSRDSIYPYPHTPIAEYLYRESSHRIKDLNGNTVGSWEFRESE